jgi:hypothetical protein
MNYTKKKRNLRKHEIFQVPEYVLLFYFSFKFRKFSQVTIFTKKIVIMATFSLFLLYKFTIRPLNQKFP